MEKIKVMTVFGTRPEAIKMAPVIQLLSADPSFELINVVTAQHREMLDQVLSIFQIHPQYDLNIMKKSQSLTDITVNVLNEMDKIYSRESPDIVLVHGDTSTTFSASLSAFYHHVPVAHVEAGLRTWDKHSPFPEEINRQTTDDISEIYFAPTKLSKNNLKSEHHPENYMWVTGNTAIDALKETVTANYHHNVLDVVNKKNRIILVTMHRRENQGKPMEDAFKAIKEVIDSTENVEAIFPVHFNPVVRRIANSILGNDPLIHLIEPLDVIDFHNLANKSYFIMTDSGGVQEEAPSLGKPVLVLRNTTERPEGIKAGTLKLVGTNPDTIKSSMIELLNNPEAYSQMANAKNPYGDGFAANRICEALKYYFNISKTAPEEFGD